MRPLLLLTLGGSTLTLWLVAQTFSPLRAASPDHAARRESTARGVVFHDRNKNQKRDPDEPGLPGVRVSNQQQIVTTDASGRFELPCGDDTTIFVIKPAGWMPPVNAQKLPRFFYTHKPAGSPTQRFPGVAPTGPLPESIDFPLCEQTEPSRFRAIFFADPQPRDLKEIEYIGHDVVEELVGADALFGVTLGDILFDDLAIFPQLNETVALIGLPWFNVIGNHDMNYDSPDDLHSDETFERYYGPNYYSFDYGSVHFIALDDVLWKGNVLSNGKKAGGDNYTGGLGKTQIEFVKNDLAGVPEDKLVVLMMHIPLTDVEDREDLYRLMETRKYCMSVSGHTHTQEHRFITKENGWRGPEPHHHVVNVTVSGSWWSGVPDERGIPHTTMRDGAPNGYSIVTFDGTKAGFEFKAAARPAEYQMEIYAPETVPVLSDEALEIVVNVFAGSERSVVEMRMDGAGDWQRLEMKKGTDPNFVRLTAEETQYPHAGRKLPKVTPSTHLWHFTLPKLSTVAEHRIDIRTKDVFGHVYTASRVIRAVAPAPASRPDKSAR